MGNYGKAAVYDFDNETKWHTVPSVPLLDEHSMTNESGREVAQVDRAVLEEIAQNNNRRIRETGDAVTLILGHTSDDPLAPEKPAVGFCVGFKVKPFKRDENGRVIFALHGDYKLRHRNAALVEQYPRRSVELWWSKREVDPVALLGGTAPERDLGAVIRHARLYNVALDYRPENTTRTGAPTEGEVIRFSRRGNNVIERYAIDYTNTEDDTVYPPLSFDGFDSPYLYGRDTTNDFDGGAESPGGGMSGMSGGDSSPVMQEVLQSKWAKNLESLAKKILAALEARNTDQDQQPQGEDRFADTHDELPPMQPGGGDFGGDDDMDVGDDDTDSGFDGSDADFGQGRDQQPEEDTRIGRGRTPPVRMSRGQIYASTARRMSRLGVRHKLSDEELTRGIDYALAAANDPDVELDDHTLVEVARGAEVRTSVCGNYKPPPGMTEDEAACQLADAIYYGRKTGKSEQQVLRYARSGTWSGGAPPLTTHEQVCAYSTAKARGYSEQKAVKYARDEAGKLKNNTPITPPTRTPNTESTRAGIAQRDATDVEGVALADAVDLLTKIQSGNASPAMQMAFGRLPQRLRAQALEMLGIQGFPGSPGGTM